MSPNRIVLQARTGKLVLGSSKQVYIDNTIVYHLGQWRGGLESGAFDGDLIKNVDEPSFL